MIITIIIINVFSTSWRGDGGGSLQRWVICCGLIINEERGGYWKGSYPGKGDVITLQNNPKPQTTSFLFILISFAQCCWIINRWWGGEQWVWFPPRARGEKFPENGNISFGV